MKYFLILLLYKFSLDIVYIKVVSQVYSYGEFGLNIIPYRYILSTMSFVIMTKPIIKLFKRISPSAIMLLLFNVLYFIPGCTLYGLSGVLTDIYFLFFMGYWILLMVFNMLMPDFKIYHRSNPSNNFIFYFLVFLFSLIAVAVTGIYNGFRFQFDLINVYENRLAAREVYMPLVFRYLYGIIAVVIPIVVVFFLIKKKYLLAIILSFIQFLLFSFGANKAMIFSLFLAYVIYYFYQEKKIVWILWGIILINIIAIFEYLYFNSFIITALGPNRTFLVPNKLSYFYFEFFQSHPYLYLRESFLRWFGLKSPYDMGISRIMGGLHYGNYETNANNGMCGDAFAQLGWLGMIVYPFLMVLVFKLFNACSKGIDIRILLISCISFAISFINASFFGVLLTNGFIAVCLFSYFLPRIINGYGSEN